MNSFFKWAQVAVVICLTMTNSLVHASENHGANDFSNKVATEMEHEQLTGAVWATVTPDNIVTGAAGLANAQSQQVLTTESKVQTASVVKTLVATGVLRLVTQGKLTLDTPVTEILADIEFDNPWATDSLVLVRHLLDHTSGLDDARLWQIMTVEAEPDTPLYQGLQQGPLMVRSRPGSRVSYSNQGYTLAGMVIEQVTGERYENYLDEHFLRPLGMHNSTFGFVSQQGQYADPALAMGHFENGVTQPTLPLYLRPAGQFTTTAKDMALFARFLMSNGEVNGKTFIAPELLSALAMPTKTEAAEAGLVGVGYALGMTSRDRHGVLAKCHSGSTIGYRTNFCIFPKQNKAFFIAFNADVETADYKKFDRMLIEELEIQPLVPVPQAAPAENISDWQGSYILVPGRNESFAYLDWVLHFASVNWDEQSLQLTPFQGKTRHLLPVGDYFFRDKSRALASHVLMISDEGKRIISDGYRTYQQVSQWQITLMWVSLGLGLLGILWLVVYGLIGLVLRRIKPSTITFVPCLSSLALLLPVPLFFNQSFLQLGDLTPASALLSLVTGLLPLAMAFGLWRSVKEGASGFSAKVNALVMLMVLQWCVVLGYWGLMPLSLWS